MKRFDVMDPKAEVEGTYVLEASAGTGKTFAIEHIVARLIEEGKTTLDRMLVVTFTRAAARELRQRIFGRLRGQELDGAKITTIHGFCAEILRDSGREIGEIDLGAVRKRRRRVVRDFLAHATYSSDQLERVLRRFGGKLVEAVDAELEKGSVIAPEWGEMPQVESEKLAEDLQEYARRYTGFVDRQGNIKLPSEVGPIVEQLQKSKLRKEAPEIRLHYPDLLERAGPLLDPKAIVKHMAAACQEEWQRVMKEEEILTYDALLDEALEGELLDDFDVIIVDEFQDTDAKQWELFQRYIERGSNFVAVGDPKQSIYAFRNADLRVYRRAVESIPLHYALDTNYRSRPSLVKALNQFFPEVRAGVEEDSELSQDPLIFFGGSEEEMFAFIAGEISQIGPPYEQFAVLVKDRYQAGRLRDFLAEQGIPSRPSRGMAVSEIAAMQDLHDLMDRSKLRQVLAGPLFDGKVDVERVLRRLEEEGVPAAVAELAGDQDIDYLEQLFAVAPLADEEVEPDRQVFLGGGRDAVQLLTTYASKGLEYSVVFALGIGSRPPREDEQDEEEKLRLVYVAMTRAIDRLYVACGHKDAPINLLCQGTPREPRPILKRQQKRWKLAERPAAKNYLERKMHSFTSLVNVEGVHFTSSPAPDDLPPGKETGILLHTLLEKGTSDVSGTRFEPWQKRVDEIVHNAWHTPLGNFCLADVEKMSAEMEFCFGLPEAAEFSGQSISPGAVKGVIDLFFEHNGRYYLLDWKSNHLSGYTQEHLEEAMHQHDYFLQAELYLQALGRYLCRVQPKPLSEVLGGVFYFFLRGPGVYRLC